MDMTQDMLVNCKNLFPARFLEGEKGNQQGAWYFLLNHQHFSLKNIAKFRNNRIAKRVLVQEKLIRLTHMPL
jgi:hypothetical protein